MQSSLIPERPLIISPTLAATIGLEEAVMLHVLSELINHRGELQRDGRRWVVLDQASLTGALPFWALIDIKRVQKSLQDLGLLLVAADTERSDQADVWRYAINQREHHDAQDDVAVLPPQVQVPQAARQGASHIASDWQPSREWMEKCRQHNIPDDFIRRCVSEFVMYWRDRGQARFSWGNAFYKHVIREWRQEQTRRGAIDREGPMSGDWWPSEDAVGILVNAGVSSAFIDDAVPEFVLYWRERGVAYSAWNSKFIEHIRRQWARYSSALVHDGLPRPIPEDWQPGPEVFDILRMAEIDEEYARQRVPEFVLYWRDTGQAHSSWNTRFLQYIKYGWARQLNGSDGVSGSAYAKDKSLAEKGGQDRDGIKAAFQRFTDRSWAD